MTVLTTIPEGTTSYLTVTFLDKDGVEAAPSSATWEVIDVESGNELQSATALTPAAVIEITIPASINGLFDESNHIERRRVIIKGSYGADDKVNDQYDYLVKNLSAV